MKKNFDYWRIHPALWAGIFAHVFYILEMRFITGKRARTHFGDPMLTVWGTGDQMRDFIYIEDCVDGVLCTMDQIDDGDALNLSTGIYTSFKQFARMAAEECGYRPEVVGLSEKPSGVFACGGCTEKQRKYGFSFSILFRRGIARAIQFFSRTCCR